MEKKLPTGKSGIEKRSKLFFGSGHILSAVTICLFSLIYFGIQISAQMWDKLIFADHISLSNSCVVNIDGQKELHSINLPTGPIDVKNHANHFNKMKIGDSLTYNCLIPGNLSNLQNIAHFGWVKASKVEVISNSKRIIGFEGLDKLAFAVNGNEKVKIKVTKGSRDSAAAFGLIGMQPPVIVEGFQKNSLVFGVEILLRIARTAGSILPFLSLGLVIAFSWFTGFRGRILTMAMYMLIWFVLARGNSLLTFFSFDILNLTKVSIILHVGYSLSILFFFMEVIRVAPKWIYKLCRIKIVLSLIAIVDLVSGFGFVNVAFVTKYSALVFAVSFLTLFIPKLRLKQSKANKVANVIAILFGFTYLIRFIFILNSNYSIQLGILTEMMIPLFVSGFMLFQFSNSEKQFLKEKETSNALSEKVLEEQSKRNVLGRFLPSSLVDRFSNHEGIEFQLGSILKPRETQVAVIQADLRGFSHLSDSTDPKEIVELLQDCFSPTVERFQNQAMIKLIGDCFFAFVEKDEDQRSHTDICMEMALSLIENVQTINRERKDGSQLNFGIGINFGSAFVGNLSSSECIDYTVIGDSVNIAARLEELSKQPKIQELVGRNGIIVGVDAISNLKKYSDIKWSPLLISGGLRSYDKIVTAAFIQKDNNGHIIQLNASGNRSAA